MQRRERYTQLNAEFQGTAWRDKKKSFFLSEQCKEIEESNRMGKTRALQKTRVTKGTFYAKMSTIKERNGMDLTEAEDIEKKWQEHTEKLHKKDHNDPDIQQWYDHSPRTRRPGI